MPTNKARISITLEDAELAVLDRFAAASGTPRASVVSQILRSTAPELERAARLMELASNATPKLLELVRADLAKATDDAMGALAPADEAYQGLIREISHKTVWKSGEATSGRRADTVPPVRVSVSIPPRRRPGPPPTNRGVKS